MKDWQDLNKMIHQIQKEESDLQQEQKYHKVRITST
jgi:hypothetical protein